VVVRLGGKTFMFDCGMHLGYQDERRCAHVCKADCETNSCCTTNKASKGVTRKPAQASSI
jgi:hypothetical protein